MVFFKGLQRRLSGRRFYMVLYVRSCGIHDLQMALENGKYPA
jgi:hypothetical protein